MTYEEAVARTEASWRDHIKNMWFALVDNHVVGMVGLLQEAGLTAKHRVHLVSFWVRPAFRSHGIGSALIKYLQEYAVNQGIKKIYLHVTTTQEKAIKLYEALGFHKVGLFKEHTKVHDKYFDTCVMEWHS